MHASRESYVSTPTLEALKVVLLEVATGERGGKVVTLVDVRRAYLYAPAQYSSNCLQRVTRQLTNTCASCCNSVCTARAKSLHRHSAISV